MTIEIHSQDTENLIQRQLDLGEFKDAEDVLLYALRTAVFSGESKQRSGLTGADLVAAMQACPYPDFEFEQPRYVSPVRDILL